MNKKIKSLLDNFEEWVTLFFFAVMCLFVLLQIITRYIMNNPLSFSDEIARYAYVWMTFIGLSLATKHNLHVKVELLDFVIKSKKASLILNIIVDIGVLLLLCFMLYLTWQYTMFSRINHWSSLPVLSMLIVNISFPIGCLLAVLRLTGLISKNIKLISQGETV